MVEINVRYEVAAREGIQVGSFNLAHMGHYLNSDMTLAEEGIFNQATLEVMVELLGGAKKKKKKAFTTPKKKKHKHKNVKLATLKYYVLDKSGKVEKARYECDSCGVGTFMAEHKNRYHCGKCSRAFTRQQASTKEAKKPGKKGGKKAEKAQ